MTLTAFLLARIADDEKRASYAATQPDFDWRRDAGGWWTGHWFHYRRQTPARVLAECDAKRRIVELHEQKEWTAVSICSREHVHELPPILVGGCAVCDQGNGRDGFVACGTLRLLALPYAGHPDYQEDWRP